LDVVVREWLGEESWELVPLVCGYITPETEAAAPHFTQCCQAPLKPQRI
jgi:hypothetical protein